MSQHLEEALTARFGLEWAARDDSSSTTTPAATFSDPGGGWVSSVAFSPNGSLLAAASSDSVQLWDAG